MELSVPTQKLLSQLAVQQQASKEDLSRLQKGSNQQYLETLTQLALLPELTKHVFLSYTDFFVDICGRWLLSPKSDKLSALSALAKILPVAPHLTIFARALLGEKHAAIEALSSGSPTAFRDIQTTELHTLLLALYRLVDFDNQEFATFVAPAQLQILFIHPTRSIRYLSTQLFCMYVHATASATEAVVKKYLDADAIEYEWEDRVINYRFLTLWEDKRISDLEKQLAKMGGQQVPSGAQSGHSTKPRIIRYQDLVKSSADFGGLLVPRIESAKLESYQLIMTESTCEDLRRIGQSFNSGKPVLVTGYVGSGKTSIIKYAAQMLGQEASMVTLHLNEQSDLKLLLGMFTSTSPGSFSWQPGILTKAVLEGRWILIENLDRAPAEIVSALLPLLERKELFVPHWGEAVVAGPGLKLIATMRTATDSHGKARDPTSNLLGRRLWTPVSITNKTENDVLEIITKSFPTVAPLAPQIMALYSALKSQTPRHDYNLPSHLTAHLNLRHLMRYCARIERVLGKAGKSSQPLFVSERAKESIFLEAVDVFALAIPKGPVQAQILRLIAQHLSIPEAHAAHCVYFRVPESSLHASTFTIGRIELPKRMNSIGLELSRRSSGNSPFAITGPISRTMESLAATVKEGEPCLLVGETGTGKTTLVQSLAGTLNRGLTVINMSQQTEISDLLGGFKPTSVATVAFPLRALFEELITATFPSKQNEHYTDALERALKKGRWPRALSLWKEASNSIDEHFAKASLRPDRITDMPKSKRRKVKQGVHVDLKERWDHFRSSLRAFEMMISGDSKGFAFSFVEGNLVKAARAGDWLLLDEINLASPDTLESLADLICSQREGQPSLLLSESGNMTRVVASQDFRIFAAMNPATDVGKGELSPNIRSRFTEIFLEPPDKAVGELVPIIQAYMGNHCQRDVRLATDIAELHLESRQLSENNMLTDGANQKTHYSLRTLARTLVYAVEIAPIYGIRRAAYEGFCMGYLTALNIESGDLLRPLIEKHILGPLKNGKALLKQIPRRPDGPATYVQFRHYWMRQGPIPIASQDHYVITPFIETNLLSLVRAASTHRFPILLQGPTSSGKTSMVEYLAKVSGHKLVRINNHEHTDLQEYLGTYVSDSEGHLNYQDGLLVQAVKEGHWIVLDELNLAPTDVLEALNRLLDDNRELLVPETQQIIRPHENFMLFATQNPPGLYGGRKVLSRAFRNRFLELHFDDIPDIDLETILRERCRIAPSFCAKIVTVYKRLSVLRRSSRMFEQRNSFATLRDLFRWGLRDVSDHQLLAMHGFLLLAEKTRDPEERDVVRKVLEEVIRVQIVEDEIYSFRNLESVLGRPLSESSRMTWTKSMRRLYKLVSECIKNHEPVLLVGETGTGKTSVCEDVSQAMQTHLHIVNCHENIETGDLIGAQRPVRDRASAKSRLLDLLRNVLGSTTTLSSCGDDELNTLRTEYDLLCKGNPESIPDDGRKEVERASTKANALFEWADGSLVKAMQDGNHYLLDEISLAEDSVLERLNSVLEPNPSLLLAEKGSGDVLVLASPKFQFFATMNPGGDYGKRELSPALRNRFTEIWVPSISDEEEIVEIVETKLPTQATNLARPMVKFASWFASQCSNTGLISIRDILAWTKFVEIHQGFDGAFSVYHGAAMVYLDRLGSSVTGFSTLMESRSRSFATRCLNQLDLLFNFNVSSFHTAMPDLDIGTDQLQIGPFSMPRYGHTSPKESYSLDAPTAKLNAMKIARALQLKKPILLEGPPGVGKTSLVSAIARHTGTHLTRINLSSQTDLVDLFGSDIPAEQAEAGNFVWNDAPFLRALLNGHWVLLDEMNLASQSVLEGLNACLDHRGQVYIPDLDRTFFKHENFVLFAAQNPHTQGGGRKGLPASFVDRFTTVYVQEFSSEDLITICCDLRPSLSRSTIEQMIYALDSVTSVLTADPIFNGQGAPWEINLRDALRWLQLADSTQGLTAFASPRDFLDLVFVSRFRTAAQRNAVQRALEPIFPTPEYSRLSNCSETSASVQVGLGFLPKSKNTTSPLHYLETSHISHANHLESIMLCIENAWPCLLVGESGSGKTAAINTIAGAVNADVICISLNSEMDAADLLGGYDQSDSRRQIAGLFSKARKHIFELMVQAALLTNSSIQLLAELDLEMSGSADLSVSNLTQIQSLLKRASSTFPSLERTIFSHELQTVIESFGVDHRTHFEWIDGVVVKAVKEGKWLVLDNANLCNPSILDRLNSLLEPNGFLSVDECPTFDGRSQTVVPHPNFRVFMTMDPRNGELSRAMRNRSVEVFVTPDKTSSLSQSIGGSLSHSISPFLSIKSFNWNTLQNPSVPYLMSICFDHFHFSDFQFLDQWEAELERGLPEMSTDQTKLLLSVAQDFGELVQNSLGLCRGIQDLYKMVESSSIQGLGELQTIHPLNNPLLLFSDHPAANCLIQSGHYFDLLIDLLHFGQTLAAVKQEVGAKTPENFSKLERSIASERTQPFHDTTPAIFPLLAGMGQLLRSQIDTNHLMAEVTSMGDTEFAKVIIRYLQDLFHLTHSSDFSDDKLQFYVTFGLSMVAPSQQKTLSSGFQTTLSNALSAKLQAFGPLILGTGLGMEQLWHHFQPKQALARSDGELELRYEALMRRFDHIVWTSGLSFQECEKMKQLLLNLDVLANRDEYRLLKSLEDVEISLADVERTAHLADAGAVPFFHDIFDALAQYRPSAAMKNADSHRIETGTISLIDNVPLARLELLRKEMDFLAETVACSCESLAANHLPTFFRELQQFHSSVSVTLQANTVPSIPEIMSGLDRSQKSFSPSAVADEAQMKMLKRAVRVAVETDATQSAMDDGSISSLASAFQMMFAGLLVLFVPDRPFDPAIRPRVLLQRHQRHVTTLENKLNALLTFEENRLKQSSSFRTHLVRQELHSLGPEPQTRLIPRPACGLSPLYSEFQNILNSIVYRLSTSLNGEHGFATSSHSSSPNLVIDNIDTAIERLSAGLQVYEDITKPLGAMLRGLRVGLSLGMLADSKERTEAKLLEHVAAVVPFVALNPMRWSEEDLLRLQTSDSASMDIGLLLLKRIALVRSLEKGLNDETKQHLNISFETYHREWKAHMQRTQAESSSRSSLFRYRGFEEPEEVDEEQDLDQMFQSQRFAPSKAVTIAGDPGAAARKLAQIHREIFAGQKTSANLMTDMIDHVATETGSFWSAESSAPVSAATLLPALILELNRRKGCLNIETVSHSTYNFYADANMAEAQKLVTLTRRVQTRFMTLKQAWPEHATLGETLDLCQSLLSFNHTDPIAKMLTKVEQLHVSVYEWQRVASRELSAAELYDELTRLIIGWRRLELSTWSRLLDMEDKRCEETASTWWFWGFDIILATPLQAIENGEDLSSYAESLLRVLEDFLKQTPVGQYQASIQMLDHFSSHLGMLSQEHKGLQPLANAIENLVAYYDNFSPSILSIILQERKVLEKELKEVLLLASWKDTNVIALRESAKRSHHKLFKVVRRYRDALSKPAVEVIDRGFGMEGDHQAPLASEKCPEEFATVSDSALDICNERLSGFADKPSRQTNPTATIKRMIQLARLPQEQEDMVMHVSEFTEGLLKDVAALRKETPSEATEQNSGFIRNLQTRKLKFFRDSIRQMRSMGLASNMNTRVLQEQSSTAAVLAKVASLKNDPKMKSHANLDFYRLLDNMGKIRASPKRCEDLTNAEVRRSVNHLESLLALIIKQRLAIKTIQSSLSISRSLVDLLTHIWMEQDHHLRKRNIDETRIEYQLRRALQWLPSIIEVGKTILEKQSGLGAPDSSQIRQRLAKWRSEFLNAANIFDARFKLPRGLSSSSHIDVQNKISSLMDDFRQDLLISIQHLPNNAFVLEQILPWTNFKTHKAIIDDLGSSETTLKDLDEAVFSTLDAIFVAIQKSHKEMTWIPPSNTTPKWMLQLDSRLSSALDAVSLPDLLGPTWEAVSKLGLSSGLTEWDLKIASALCGTALPIMEQFHIIQRTMLCRFLDFHASLCYMASMLSSIFLNILRDGFCRPSEKTNGEAGESQNLEPGTGLGDGEGAEDISKDVQQDEDLAELAQDNGNERSESFSGEDDAVNMDHEDLQGDMKDASEANGSQDEQSDVSDDDQLDEEIDSVDTNDPTAVDEKLWDEAGKDSADEKTQSKPQDKSKGTDRQKAADQDAKDVADETESLGSAKSDEIDDLGADEDENVTHTENEELDNRVQDGQRLDLPEEMELDSMDGSEKSDFAQSDLESSAATEEGKEDAIDEMGTLDDDADMDEKTALDGLDDQETRDVDECKSGSPPRSASVRSEERELDNDLIHEDIAQNKGNEEGDAVSTTKPEDLGPAENVMESRTQYQQHDVTQNDDREPSKTEQGGKADMDGEEIGTAHIDQGNAGNNDRSNSGEPKNPWKQLGDTLEKWHRINNEIQDAGTESEVDKIESKDLDKAQEQYEHVGAEHEGEMQALGAASEEQASALDNAALDSEMQDASKSFEPGAALSDKEGVDEDRDMTEFLAGETDTQAHEEQHIGPTAVTRRDNHEQNGSNAMLENLEQHDELDKLNQNLSITHIEPQGDHEGLDADEAQRLWAYNEKITRDLSQYLTERLRLILAPTLATKMRGDFRTGKRLNIKRIIPYIASNYKRDKIWMRRSIPSKRNYQIILAVDDSKSMKESGAGRVAFQALTMVAKSLNMLEVGEICIAGFGAEVFIAHAFDQPFSSHAGGLVYQHFGFDQTTTDVRRLIEDSIRLFRDARRRQTSSGADTWQLQLIISDGVCEDHEAIKRLLQQAFEEGIMIVFIVVDALVQQGSILEMTQAVFEPDSATGEPTLKMKRYLDSFPFNYYVVVSDVKDLPAILAQALRQWFAEVAST